MLYEAHEIAKIFPKMQADELEALTLDIKQHGLIEPILLFEGKILDGRNRYSACIKANIEGMFAEYEGSDPVSHVLSLNLKRRHLDESQRAMVADNLAKLPPFRPAKSPKNNNRKKSNVNKCANLSTSMTQAEAASALNVSRRSIQKARKIKTTGTDELQEKVIQGDISLNAAEKLAKLPKGEQKKIIAAGNEAIKKAVKKVAQEVPTEPEEYTEIDRLNDEIIELKHTISFLLEKDAVESLPEDQRISAEQIIMGLREENRQLSIRIKGFEDTSVVRENERNAMLKRIKGLEIQNKILTKEAKKHGT